MLELGQKVGNYRILRKIGEGGMGAVFEGVHAHIKRHVAIKVLHENLASQPTVAARFCNEAWAANRIQHLGVVEVLDYGHLPTGAPYIAMEFLDGESLAKRVATRGGALGLEEVLLICQQIAGTLSAAHKLGIVHRDVKPDNVMLVSEPRLGSKEVVKILDFGIAKLSESLEIEANGGRLKLTQTGTVLGTALYMAPEQCMGNCQVDGKADVYALGAMIFHLLAGRPPFLGEGAGATMAKHMDEEPPILANLVPELPRAVSELVSKMLRKAPEARPLMIDVHIELQSLASLRPIAHVASMPLYAQETLLLSPLHRLRSTMDARGQCGASIIGHKGSIVKMALGFMVVIVTAGSSIWGSLYLARSDPGGFRTTARVAGDPRTPSGTLSIGALAPVSKAAVGVSMLTTSTQRSAAPPPIRPEQSTVGKREKTLLPRHYRREPASCTGASLRSLCPANRPLVQKKKTAH